MICISYHLFWFVYSLVYGVPIFCTDQVSVMEGDSVTLNTEVMTNQQDRIKWYFNGTLIAEISGDLSFICADDQCLHADGSFRDRLKVNHLTGSLTITDTRTTDSGLYDLLINSRNSTTTVTVCGIDGFAVNTEHGHPDSRTGMDGHDVNPTDRESLFVVEGDSVTLHTDTLRKPDEKITWHFNNFLVGQITESQICTDVQCDEANWRFRGRLDLDHTGSLTITNTTNTDDGLYHLKVSSSRYSSEKTFDVLIIGLDGFVVNPEYGHPNTPTGFNDNAAGSVGDPLTKTEKGSVSVSVKKGDSVTLHSEVTTEQKGLWYFNDTFIAKISAYDRSICTDVQCSKGNERFRDRLKLDDQTGSLTIRNIRSSDSGRYKNVVSDGFNHIFQNFSVIVHDVPGDEQDEIKKTVKEGQSVTLDSDVNNPNSLMTWYFNEDVITKNTGDPNKTFTDGEFNERFRDRLNLDHQTGSLNITNIRAEDSGLYELQIHRHINNSITISSFKSFSVNVTALEWSLSSAAVSGISVAVSVVVLLLIGVSLCVIYTRRKRQAGQNDIRTDDSHQANDVEDLSSNQNGTISLKTSSPSQTESANETPT